jgi:hypothetical protein
LGRWQIPEKEVFAQKKRPLGSAPDGLCTGRKKDGGALTFILVDEVRTLLVKKMEVP